MKLNITKEWLAKRASLDDNCEITTGPSNMDELTEEVNELTQTPFEVQRLLGAFGRLISLLRSSSNMTVNDLSKNADIDASELTSIENTINFIPEYRTVIKLAGYFEIPENRLLELSGNVVISSDNDLNKHVERFAAKANRIDTISEEQYEALQDFVNFLAKK